MKEEWKTKELTDCIQRVSKTSKIPKKKFLSSGTYPIISQESSFINGYWNNKEDLIEINKPVVIFGDHTRLIKYVDFSFVRGADGVIILLPIEEINSKFFSYQLQSIKLRDLGYARHYKLLKQEIISIPPIEVQIEIVEILDQTLESIEKAQANVEKNIENTKELFENWTFNLFNNSNWNKSKWGEVCDFIRGPFGGSLTKSMFIKSGYAVYEQRQAIHNDYDAIRYFVNEEKFLEMKRFEVKPGDLLISCSGTIGRISEVPQNAPQGIINQALLKLRTKKGLILNRFFVYWIRSKIFQDLIYKSSGGAAQVNVPGVKILKEISIPCPSIKEQEEILKTLDNLDSLVNSSIYNYEKELESLEELKKSILQKAFTGELTNKKDSA